MTFSIPQGKVISALTGLTLAKMKLEKVSEEKKIEKSEKVVSPTKVLNIGLNYF